jgi:type IV pilus assembly protein PilQ
MQTNSRNGGNKIPVLGSVPVLGRLFRSDTRNNETTNLIIFITAKTISAEGAAIEQVFDSSRVRQLEITREELPGYRDGSNPFLSAPKPAGSK